MTGPDLAGAVGLNVVELAEALVRVVAQNGTGGYANSTLDDPVRAGDFAEALARPYLGVLGPIAPVMLGMFVFGVTYIWSGQRLALPTTLLVVVGGFLLPFLPPAAATGAYVLILGGVGLALWSAWNGGGARPR